MTLSLHCLWTVCPKSFSRCQSPLLGAINNKYLQLIFHFLYVVITQLVGVLITTSFTRLTFIKIMKTSWSIEVLLTNYRTTWCCFYYTDQLEDYNIEQLKNQLEILYCLWQLAVEINTSVEKDLEQTVQRHCNESLWGGEFFSISIWRWTAELLGRRPPPLPPR